ncbi:protein FAM110C-like [Scleropages formosus]|uniref:Protein FAM110C-like n=1 Tax=Scleropages formosus TaxID=113540 RepID=A0A0P7Y6N1_SCLFO|nr:protein FAM110C-like [Scleropages formosus]
MHANKPGVDTTRILEKGPGYFRKHMEREAEAKGRESRPSAVERLAASKPKYVKSPQVAERSREPAATTRSPSASSNGSSTRSSSGRLRTRARQDAEPRRRDPSPAARRSSSKKQRPDSLRIYRHKHENVKEAANDAGDTQGKLVRRLFLNSLKEKAAPPPDPEGAEKQRGPKRSDNTCVDSYSSKDRETGPAARTERDPLAPALLGSGKRVPNPPPPPASEETESRPRRGVIRSHSDISSRYSRNFSEFETFFKYCGLDSDVVEALGKENFSARSDELEHRLRSVSTSTSEDGFARRSDCSDGLLEEELGESVRQNTSVIERNARVIKWLYSCRNASETGKMLRDLE